MKMETNIRNVVIRFCENCGHNTEQVIDFSSWYKVITTCMNEIEDGRTCKQVHIFTLSYVKGDLKPVEEYTRTTFKIGISGGVVMDKIETHPKVAERGRLKTKQYKKTKQSLTLD